MVDTLPPTKKKKWNLKFIGDSSPTFYGLGWEVCESSLVVQAFFWWKSA